ncbi:hypothetical protein KUCAC02_002790 [Chaenocephalus aceratus]|uniref:Uncharacterized protein n=1 Tax=Chaenocephalus aceratus TaxID=36190 RepID=A0ACB9WK75_CHAAC|nr:hypothetical protein KUCAC02_002790 [Chaenocephalus aceratus]
MSYLSGHASTEAAVSISPDSMNSHEPPTESIMRPSSDGFHPQHRFWPHHLHQPACGRRSPEAAPEEEEPELGLRPQFSTSRRPAGGEGDSGWVPAGSLDQLPHPGFLPVMVRQLQTKDYGGFCAFFSVINHMGIIMLFSACFFPVLSVFVYIYLDILKIACSHQKQICQVRQAGSRTGDRQDYENHPHQPHQQLRSHYWSHVKALRTVGVLVGCFLVLWCPFFVACIVHLLCESCQLKGVLENYLWLLGLSNSLINTLVYAFWQREVRLQLASLCSCFRALAARPPCFTERCDAQPPVLNQAGAPAGENLNPSLLRAISVNDKVQTVPLSASTGL